jgi:hypothetical protein
MIEHDHHTSCTGCTNSGEGYQCHGCGHWRDAVTDYSHGYYCTDCVIAITCWRRAEDAYRQRNR